LGGLGDKKGDGMTGDKPGQQKIEQYGGKKGYQVPKQLPA
jgi:hypothetical protein